MNPFPALVALCLVPIGAAQSMTCTIASNGLLQANLGPQVVSTPMPASANAPAGYLVAQAANISSTARSSVAWQVARTPAVVTFHLLHQVQVTGPGNGASFTPGDFLLHLQSPVTVPVRLELQREFVLVAGMPLPALLVDVGDDGSAELDSSTPSGVTVPVWLPPGTVDVRVRALVSLGSPGSAAHALSVRLLPAHATAFELGFGCAAPGLAAVPLFSGEIELAQQCGACNGPWLVVIGSGLHPVPLPSPWPLCLLVPTPDLVLFGPGAVSHTLAIPPALRPLTFFAQSVTLIPLGPASGSTFRVDAI
ncbi:MAG TPA: hypothetical protein VFZ65_03095 [Planctomycetota bacterium]|nr:hypothetical protein [Planctomycetota bacterium]